MTLLDRMRRIASRRGTEAGLRCGERRFTLADLEGGSNAAARVLGTVAIILAYVTIAAYQFRGGGWILSIVTDGAITAEQGIYITAAVIVLFTALLGFVVFRVLTKRLRRLSSRQPILHPRRPMAYNRRERLQRQADSPSKGWWIV